MCQKLVQLTHSFASLPDPILGRGDQLVPPASLVSQARLACVFRSLRFKIFQHLGRD